MYVDKPQKDEFHNTFSLVFLYFLVPRHLVEVILFFLSVFFIEAKVYANHAYSKLKPRSDMKITFVD